MSSSPGCCIPAHQDGGSIRSTEAADPVPANMANRTYGQAHTQAAA